MGVAPTVTAVSKAFELATGSRVKPAAQRDSTTFLFIDVVFAILAFVWMTFRGKSTSWISKSRVFLIYTFLVSVIFLVNQELRCYATVPEPSADRDAQLLSSSAPPLPFFG